MSPLQTVGALKKQIQEQHGYSMGEQRLICAGKQLHNDRTIASYNPQNANPLTLHLVLSLRGGASEPLRFVDITEDSAVTVLPWASYHCEWHTASPGLCLEGVCTNTSCEAYCQKVIYNHHFQAFDLRTSSDAECPMCFERIRPEKPAFNNCFYKISAIKHGGSGWVYERPWTRAGDEYVT